MRTQYTFWIVIHMHDSTEKERTCGAWKPQNWVQWLTSLWGETIHQSCSHTECWGCCFNCNPSIQKFSRSRPSNEVPNLVPKKSQFCMQVPNWCKFGIILVFWYNFGIIGYNLLMWIWYKRPKMVPKKCQFCIKRHDYTVFKAFFAFCISFAAFLWK